METRLTRWAQMWADENIPYTKAHEEMYAKLCECYKEPCRFYHVLGHIGHCLDLFEYVRPYARDPLALGLAIWFHDAVYRAGNSDNERKSAELFLDFAEQVKLPVRQSECVARMITATTHKAKDVYHHPDAYLLLDLDLSSLGLSSVRFDRNSRELISEMHCERVENPEEKQRMFLQMLAERSRIYYTKYFRTFLEPSAQANISRTLGVL
jgi:predicted metal-dependent HD superfamily phosphohydrolase